MKSKFDAALHVTCSCQQALTLSLGVDEVTWLVQPEEEEAEGRTHHTQTSFQGAAQGLVLSPSLSWPGTGQEETA